MIYFSQLGGSGRAELRAAAAARHHRRRYHDVLLLCAWVNASHVALPIGILSLMGRLKPKCMARQVLKGEKRNAYTRQTADEYAAASMMTTIRETQRCVLQVQQESGSTTFTLPL